MFEIDELNSKWKMSIFQVEIQNGTLSGENNVDAAIYYNDKT